MGAYIVGYDISEINEAFILISSDIDQRLKALTGGVSRK
jgi:hypothetical protein